MGARLLARLRLGNGAVFQRVCPAFSWLSRATVTGLVGIWATSPRVSTLFAMALGQSGPVPVSLCHSRQRRLCLRSGIFGPRCRLQIDAKASQHLAPAGAGYAQHAAVEFANQPFVS